MLNTRFNRCAQATEARFSVRANASALNDLLYADSAHECTRLVSAGSFADILYRASLLPV